MNAISEAIGDLPISPGGFELALELDRLDPDHGPARLATFTRGLAVAKGSESFALELVELLLEQRAPFSIVVVRP